MKKSLLLLLSTVIWLSMQAQIRGNEITVTVTPDHKDWNYRVGEKAKFVVNVLRSGTLIDNVSIDYEAGPEMYPEVKKENVTLKDGTMKWQGSLKKPGFYRLKVTAHVDGKAYHGLCTAAFNPEAMKPTTKTPDDFDTFWQQALKEARYTTLEPTKTLLPERCTKDVNVYEVSFQNMRWGSRTFGILCVPVKPGKYPALLRVPGAGVRPYTGDAWFASQGAIVLEIGIHGVSVTQPQVFYDNLFNGALNNYWEFNTADRDRNYYKRVVIGAIRAIDYIEEYTPWDGKNLGVTGSSQGGFLTLACAGLDRRVSCYGAVHAAMCDYEAALTQTACGWPHYYFQQKNPDMKQVEASRYYDGVNFARRITAPGWFSFGYNDEVVPPTTAYATYNVVTAPKILHPYQMTGHYWYQEQWDEWVDWLQKQLHIKTQPVANEAGKLEKRMHDLQPHGYMYGHQDDPFYGLSWEWDYGKSDILATVGDYPAVMGFDLGGIEKGDAKNLDSVPFTRIHDELLAHVKRGGIVTISWHPRNPLTGGTAWDVTSDQVVKSILPGGSKHALFQQWMKRVADFLTTLKDENGLPVPVIFRPWHENNGSWFWWGQKLCTDDEFLGLWNMLQDYLNQEGLDNLLWSYSPNLDGGWTEERFMKRYPGNDRVTLIGEDAYQWGTEEDFVKQLTADLDFISSFAQQNGKLFAMTECGYKNIPDATWWTRVLKPIMDKYPISYFLTWRNYKKEYFAPDPDQVSAKDFKKLYQAKNTLFLKNIVNIK